jgi:hypothetical protein
MLAIDRGAGQPLNELKAMPRLMHIKSITAGIIQHSASALGWLGCMAFLSMGLAVGAKAEEASIPSNFTTSTFLVSCTPMPGPNCGFEHSPELPGDEGKLRFNCNTGQLLYDDPIVSPGKPGVTHLHHFFGNTSTNAYSTYSILRQNGEGNCSGGKLNRTAYWFPAMIDGQGRVRIPDLITVYYTVVRRDVTTFDNGHGLIQTAAQRFPRGMKFIGGYRMDLMDGTTSFTSLRWDCVGSSTGTGAVLWDRSNNANGVVGCSSNDQILVRMNLPNCWDGSTMDDAANGHHTLRKQEQDGFGNQMCTSGFLNPLPQILVQIYYSHDGQADYSQWYLSSDRFNGANKEAGATIHTDWFGAWDDDIMATWTAEVNGIPLGGIHVRDTTNGALGDGTALKEAGIVLRTDGSKLTGADRYTAMPYPNFTGTGLRAKNKKAKGRF